MGQCPRFDMRFRVWSPFLAVSIWVVIYIRFRFRVIFLGVLYYFGDLKGDPNLENYPFGVSSLG